MNPQNKHSKLKLVALCGVVVLAVGIVGAYFVLRNTDSKAKPVAKLTVFSFDADKAPGWHRSPLGTEAKEARRSLLVFDHDVSVPKETNDTKSCHVSAFLNQGTVNVDAKRKGIEQMDYDGRKLSLIDTLDLSLKKTSGSEKYTLYRYDYTGGSDKFKNGNAFGYVQVKGHYVEIQVICDTFEMLNSATDVLRAIRYDENVPKNDLF